MILPPLYTQLINASGVHLDQINPGSNEVALPRKEALDALQLLTETSIAVLGGDVLQIAGGKLEYVYANWYCNQLEDEDFHSYAERSRCEAVSYIEKFHAIGGFEPLFVFVLSGLGK